MRSTIEIRGARENNLRNVTVEIPRDRLVVVTGVSGSGKSSLAFDTLYAEGQRRLLASMSAFSKRFVQQLKKPAVDVVQGLSPVVSIDQKTVSKNPRSTVGTMTDILDYLRMLFATLGTPRCPDCEQIIPALSARRLAEHVAALPAGTEVELLAPAWVVFGEDWDDLFEQIRVNGYRRIRVAGELRDLGDEVSMPEDAPPWVDVVIDRFVAGDGVDRHLLAALEHGRKIGDGLFSFRLLGKVAARTRKAFEKGFGCTAHGRVAHAMHHADFSFNDPSGACRTCSGIGRAKRVWPPLLVPDTERTLRDGALVKEALNADRNTWGGRVLETLASHFEFSLDVPFSTLPEQAKTIIFEGARDVEIPIVVPEGARQGQHHAGKPLTWRGLVPQIERQYHHYRKHGDANNWMEDYLEKVMVEYACPECEGARLKAVRRLVTVADRNLAEVCGLDLVSLLAFLESLELPAHQREVAAIMLREIESRLRVLIDIGLDYLSLDRTSGTLSGGEAQRIRLSSQIGSGLMGMLYVLDEPSIGLHSKDNEKMIATLRSLRDLGNTVVVIEHDEDTIRAADHVVEVGPGPGVHGGQIVAEGTPDAIAAHEQAVTGAYLSGRRAIPVPAERRPLDDNRLRIRGARHNNLRSVDVEIPLGVLTCITGASGSGKSSLIHDTLQKELGRRLVDSRIIPGEHDDLDGAEHVDEVVDIDQSPIGRSPRSNPATYIGFYDDIRKLFAGTDAATERGWTASRFSFNVKGGRCEACGGEGTITTRLSFMPDVEVTCPTCKGARYNSDTLEVTYRGKTIADVLEMSIEEGASFFADAKGIARKVGVLDELGLGYLKIGHPATILSGGEAQRIKLAEQLGKMRRGKHILYLLDEPTTGLHFADIQRLLDALARLIDRGHSVVVIEHNLHVIKTADWVVDLGPEGGAGGGALLVAGRPEEVAACTESHTGRFLKDVL